MKQYYFDFDWYLGYKLHELNEFDNNYNEKYIYNINIKINLKEKETIEYLGDNFISRIYVLFINIKYHILP